MANLMPCKATSIVLLLVFYVWPSMGVLFSTLPRSLVVTASPKPGQVLYAGEGKITVTWALNQNLPAGTDSRYNEVKVRLCYAPVSQFDHGWRKSDDNLNKDKTCQFKIVQQLYTGADDVVAVEYTVDRNVPTATYYIRAYVLDDSGTQVAYGQTTNAKKTSNLFDIVGIIGHHPAFDIAAACFSAFSVAVLIFFLVIEKRKTKK